MACCNKDRPTVGLGERERAGQAMEQLVDGLRLR
jgi:hypothetical protein